MLTRKRVAELMDDPALDYSSHAEALRGLERLNFVSTSAASLWSQIKPLTKQKQHAQPFRILDIATGGGDIPVALLKAAALDGVQIEIVHAEIDFDRQLDALVDRTDPQPILRIGQIVIALRQPQEILLLAVLDPVQHLGIAKKRARLLE